MGCLAHTHTLVFPQAEDDPEFIYTPHPSHGQRTHLSPGRHSSLRLSLNPLSPDTLATQHPPPTPHLFPGQLFHLSSHATGLRLQDRKTGGGLPHIIQQPTLLASLELQLVVGPVQLFPAGWDWLTSKGCDLEWPMQGLGPNNVRKNVSTVRAFFTNLNKHPVSVHSHWTSCDDRVHSMTTAIVIETSVEDTILYHSKGCNVGPDVHKRVHQVSDRPPCVGTTPSVSALVRGSLVC